MAYGPHIDIHTVIYTYVRSRAKLREGPTYVSVGNGERVLLLTDRVLMSVPGG